MFATIKAPVLSYLETLRTLNTKIVNMPKTVNYLIVSKIVLESCHSLLESVDQILLFRVTLLQSS